MTHKILLVEDSPTQAARLKHELEQQGLTVIQANNGKQGLAVARQQRPDVILSDILMPVMDGFQLCKNLRQDPELHTIPVILLTATFEPGADQEFALRLGADAYVDKKITPNELVSCIAQVINNRYTPSAPPSGVPVDDQIFQDQHRERLQNQLVLEAAKLEQANEALLQSEASFRLLFTNHPHPMWVYDLKTLRFLEVNNAAVENYGYSRDEFLGMRIADIRPAEDVERLRQDLAQKRPALQASNQWRHRFKNGRIIDVEITSHLIEFDGRQAALVVAQDVTKRVQAERALKESEAKYQDLYHNAPDMYASVDAQSATLIECNQTLVRVTGYSRAELIGRSIFDIYHPDCHPQVEKAFRRFVETGTVPETELQLKRKDGSKIDVSLTVSAVRDEQGNILYSRSSWRDITDRKQVEEEKERFVALVENSNEFIGLATPAGQPIYLNPAGRKLVGLNSLEDLQELSISDFYPDSLQARLYHEALPQALETGLWRGEIQIRNFATDELIDVEQTIFPIYDPNTGEVSWLPTVMRDIRERKQNEAALRESEERFRATFEQAAVGIAHVAPDGRWLRVNQRLCDIVGYSRKELSALTFQDITHPEDLETDLENVQQVLANEISSYDMEKRYIRKDGSPIWINLTVSLVREADGAPKYFIAVIEDIAHRKQTEAMLARRREELRHSNQELQQFAYVVSHDLQEPLRMVWPG